MPMMFHSLDEVGYVRERLRPLLGKRFEAKGFEVLFLADAGWFSSFRANRCCVQPICAARNSSPLSVTAANRT